MPSIHFRKTQPASLQTVLLLIGVMLLVATLAVAFFFRSRDVIASQVKERLRATAAAAAMQFDAADFDAIRSRADMKKPAFRAIVRRLDTLRTTVPDISFVYILRKTSEAHQLAFVADADSLTDKTTLDTNQDGILQPDEEASYPGDLYDISDIPALQRDAFDHPVTDSEVTTDQWGALMSGYAPIRDSAGNVRAVLGLDMRAEDFTAASYAILSPATLLFLLLAGIIIGLWILRISWQRQISMLTKMNSERTNLLRLTHHQLGGPLTIFKWSLELIEDAKDEHSCLETLPQFSANMREGISRMNGIIEALDSAEKVELGTMPTHPQSLNVADVCAQAVQQTDAITHPRHQRIAVDCDHALTVTFDPPQLLEVLTRILTNASDYSPENAAIALTASDDGGTISVTVQDSGCGIPRSDLPHVTEKYIRAGNAVTMQPNGNGLGLYIVRGILEAGGGTLQIESTQGKGTTVTITLPR